MKSNKELIIIKTKYKTKAECIQKCRDFSGKTNYDWIIQKKFSGGVYPNGRFELSAMSGAGANQIFMGQIIESDAGVFMEGMITPKIFVKKFLKTSAVLTAIVTPIYIYTQHWLGALFMFFVFCLIIWNYVLTYFSESLQKQITKKVS